MNNFRFPQTRREFLSVTPLFLLACAKTNSAQVQLQIPYVEKHRFKLREIEKIMGGNWVRVLTESL